MSYCTEGGIDYTAITNMLSADRAWYLRRLHKQLKKEAEETKKAGRKGRRRR